MTARTFSIPNASFEGPLELLIELIEKRKLLVNDVSLAAVTDEYMSYVREFEEHPVGETAQFVLVASTLLLIKSKSLLPILDLTEEEVGDMKELERRLKQYQLFRDASQKLSAQFGKVMLYERPFVAPTDPLFIADKYTNLETVALSLRELIGRYVKKPFVPTAIVKKIITLEEMMKRLETRILSQFKMRFKDFAGEGAEKGTVIVGFLAVLELVKQGFVNVRQEAHFEEIHIEKDDVGIPKYH